MLLIITLICSGPLTSAMLIENSGLNVNSDRTAKIDGSRPFKALNLIRSSLDDQHFAVSAQDVMTSKPQGQLDLQHSISSMQQVTQLQTDAAGHQIEQPSNIDMPQTSKVANITQWFHSIALEVQKFHRLHVTKGKPALTHDVDSTQSNQNDDTKTRMNHQHGEKYTHMKTHEKDKKHKNMEWMEVLDPSALSNFTHGQTMEILNAINLYMITEYEGKLRNDSLADSTYNSFMDFPATSWPEGNGTNRTNAISGQEGPLAPSNGDNRTATTYGSMWHDDVLQLRSLR